MTLNSVTLRDRFEQLRSNKLFETFVILVIVISALMIGAKTYPIPAAAAQVLRIMDVGITLFFLTEIIIRMVAEKNLKAFFSKGWNIFDFLIVTASLIPVDDSEAALLGRLLRVFRVLRLVSIIPELRILMNAFVSAIPRMGYVSL
ncbi:MAG: ion transporter, partial [Candidatus Thiodiazotropha sp.]